MILYYMILYYMILYYMILYDIILYYIINTYTILYYIIYCIILYIVLYYIILYYIILYYIILYYIMLYYIIYIHRLLNFTRSWVFGSFRVYWVSKSKCIISSNLRAEGSWGKALNVVIFVESVVHRSNWRSRETETVGNSQKQSGAARRDHAKIVNPPFFCKKKLSAQSHFFFESATGNSWK